MFLSFSIQITKRKRNNLLDYFLYAAKNVAKEDEVKFFAFPVE